MKRRSIFLIILLIGVLTIVVFAVRKPNGPKTDTTVVIGATLFDGTGRPPIEDSVIAIKGNQITQVGARSEIEIPKGGQVVYAQGKFVIPGLADMHSHLARATFDGAPPGIDPIKRNLAKLMVWGVTTIFDSHLPAPFMELLPTIRSTSEENTAPYSRFFTAGPILTAKDGWGSQLGGYPLETADEARAKVRDLKRARVDAVKLVYDDMTWLTSNSMRPLRSDMLAAIIDEAHKQGLKIFVHAPILHYAKEALRAGADGLVHGILSDPVDDEFLELMKKNHGTYMSTLAVFENCADSISWVAREAALADEAGIEKEIFEAWLQPETVGHWRERWNNTAYVRDHLPILKANLKKVLDAGIPIVIGTDSGVPGVLFGVSTHIELAMHVQAGLRPKEAIRAATLNAARMIGREGELGSVEPGKLADLLILDADPLADIHNTRRIYRIIKGGVAFDPKRLLHEMK